MKIANKIIVLVAVLLAVLAANTFVGLAQLNRVQQEFSAVVTRDVVLMESLMAVTQHQLEKNVLLAKLFAITEELGFASVPFARAQYLNDQLKILSEGFEQVNASGAEAILKAQVIVTGEPVTSSTNLGKWRDATQILSSIKQAYQQHDQLVRQMMTVVRQGNFQLSLDDLSRFKSQEAVLSQHIKALLSDVQGFVRASLAQADETQHHAQRLMLICLSTSIAASGLMAVWIIQGFVIPLRRLSDAARQFGQGNFIVRLPVSSGDEIAQVSGAFNAMSVQLQEFTQKLERHNQDLVQVNQELDRFVHTVSHDIVGPLTTIVGYGAYLEQNYANQLDPKGRDSILGVRKGASRLNKLIKDLLELTRMTRVKNPYTSTAMSEVVQEAIGHNDFIIQESRARINVVDLLPVVVCDRIKMTIAMTNLIGNAVKFSSKNNPQGPLVTIGYQATNNGHEFFVQDNGIGIAPKDHMVIFDIFKRLHTLDTYEGSGAGLAIVKAAIEDQGGHIRVESQPGFGAKFIVSLPKNLPCPFPLR